MSPDEIAAAVLDAHAIQDHWVRNRAQIQLLITEAVKLDRAERAAWERENNA